MWGRAAAAEYDRMRDTATDLPAFQRGVAASRNIAKRRATTISVQDMVRENTLLLGYYAGK